MNRAHVIVLLGPPGSGKGTQAKELASKKEGWVHISTGDLFRKEIHSGSELGNSVKGILAAGSLVPDAVTNQVFQSQVQKILSTAKPKVLLLDGYPRTGEQGKSLVEFTRKNSDKLGTPVVVSLDVSLENIVQRLGGRLVNPRTGRVYHRVMSPPKVSGICDEDGQPLIQRDDDKEETIRKRYQVFVSEKDAILAALGGQPMKVNGEGSPADVTERLASTISKLMN
jgi:adenylate kinase